MITKTQIILIQQAKRHLCKTCGLDDHWYREALRHNGRVGSSKDLDQGGFERVMGVFEGLGFRDTDQLAGTRADTHWRDKADLQGRYASARQVYLIEQLVQQTKYAPGLGGLCGNFSNGRTEQVTRLYPKQAHKLIEALKDMLLKYPLPTTEAE